MKNSVLRKTTLAVVLHSIIQDSAIAGTVRDDIDYNIYRNFAENRGPFKPGAANIPILFKNGTLAGTLGVAPMPDWSGLNTRGFSQLIDPRYIATAHHNLGFRGVEFGYNNKVDVLIDNHEYGYQKVAHNYQPQSNNNGVEYGTDFSTPRLDKLVTEATAIGMTSVPWSAFEDNARFPIFYRAGAGTQYVKSPDGTTVFVKNTYRWRNGGVITDVRLGGNNWLFGVDTETGLFTDKNLPLPIHTNSGDSGSPLIAWDTQENKWVYVGAVYGSNDSDTLWNLGNYDSFQKLIAKNTDSAVDNVDRTTDIQWNATSLDQNSSSWVWHGTDPTAPDTTAVSPGLSALDAGKDLSFNGAGATLVLNQNVNMGAGVLTLNNDYTLKAATDQTWVGGGLIVNGPHTLLWQVNGVAGDSLHKLGAGTLHINAVGINAGQLNVGEGTVLLDQHADSSGKLQAFSSIDIVSGRATVVLANSQQVNPDNIYFGFRGGRLDVNGNDLSFSHIRNVDNGAQVVNHHLGQTSTVTVTAAASRNVVLTAAGTANKQTVNYDFFKGKLGEDDATQDNGRLNFTFAPSSADRLLELSGGANLNGDISVTQGTLLLSGYAELNADTSLYGWEHKQYKADKVSVADNAVFKLGNHASLSGALTAGAGSLVTLGNIATGDTSDLRAYTSECLVGSSVTCTYGAEQTGDISSFMAGTIDLKGNSELLFGRAQFAGGIQGESGSSVTMTGQSQWLLDQASRLHRLNLQAGSRLAFASTDTPFTNLTINDAFQADGTVFMRSHLYTGHADSVEANGPVSGNLTLAVIDSSGEQPASARPVAYLPLLSLGEAAQPLQGGLNVRLQNGYVDAGNYRYLLNHRTADVDTWGLYNGLLDGMPAEQQHWTSRMANAILSDNDTHFESLLSDQAQLQGYLDNLRTPTGGIWFDTKTTQNRFESGGVRPRSQAFTTQRAGGDAVVELGDSSLVLGAALGQTRAKGKFDQAASNEGTGNTVSVYAKWTLPSRLFFTGSAGYNRYDNELKVEDKTPIERHAWLTSLGIGYPFEVSGVTLQPSLTATLIVTPKERYEVDNLNVDPASRSAQQYRAGLNLSKSLVWADTPLTPWLNLAYNRTQRHAPNLVVGDDRFESFGREDRADAAAGVTVGLGKSVQVTAYGGYAEGSYVDSQVSGGLNLKWEY